MYFWTSGRIESGGSEENIVPAFHPNGRLVGEFILYLAPFSINGGALRLAGGRFGTLEAQAVTVRPIRDGVIALVCPVLVAA